MDFQKLSRLSDAIRTQAVQFSRYEWTLFLKSIEHCGVLVLFRLY